MNDRFAGDVVGPTGRESCTGDKPASDELLCCIDCDAACTKGTVGAVVTVGMEVEWALSDPSEVRKNMGFAGSGATCKRRFMLGENRRVVFAVSLGRRNDGGVITLPISFGTVAETDGTFLAGELVGGSVRVAALNLGTESRLSGGFSSAWVGTCGGENWNDAPVLVGI